MQRRRPFLAKNPDLRHYIPAASPVQFAHRISARLDLRHLFAEKTSSAVGPGSWQCSAVDPSLPKTRTLGIMFMPQARANPLPFAQDFGKAGPTAPFCRKGLKCRRPGLVCPGSWQCSAVDPSLPKPRL